MECFAYTVIPSGIPLENKQEYAMGIKGHGAKGIYHDKVKIRPLPSRYTLLIYCVTAVRYIRAQRYKK